MPRIHVGGGDPNALTEADADAIYLRLDTSNDPLLNDLTFDYTDTGSSNGDSKGIQFNGAGGGTTGIGNVDFAWEPLNDIYAVRITGTRVGATRSAILRVGTIYSGNNAMDLYGHFYPNHQGSSKWDLGGPSGSPDFRWRNLYMSGSFIHGSQTYTAGNIADVSIAETISSAWTFSNLGQTIIDTTNAEALLVRKDSDAEDILAVDTSGRTVTVGDSTKTSGNGPILRLYGTKSAASVYSYAYTDSAGRLVLGTNSASFILFQYNGTNLFFISNVGPSVADNVDFVFGTGTDNRITHNANGANDSFVIGLKSNYEFYVTERNNRNTTTTMSGVGTNQVHSEACITFLDADLTSYTQFGFKGNDSPFINTEHEFDFDFQGATKAALTSTGFRVDGYIGFYGATPVAQPTGFTQTYSTTTRTHGNFTSAAITDGGGGSADGITGAVSGTGDDSTINNNFADVISEFNKLRVDVGVVKNLINQIIDDDQACGLRA